jgi:hypothetical protein
MTLDKIRPQQRNANKHTQRGMGMLEQSIQNDGFIGAITVAADDETFDGSARLEVLAAAFDGVEPIVVESYGDRPIVHRRLDIPNASDPRAVRLGVAANRIAQVNLDFDPAMLAGLQLEADLSSMFLPEEISGWSLPDDDSGGGSDGDLGDHGPPPSDGSLLALAKITIAEPTHQVTGGDVWHLGNHVLICADVFRQWHQWIGWLQDPAVFVPYPGPFIVFGDKLQDQRLVLVQPDAYIAGHILDQYVAIHGEGTVTRG